MGRRLARSGRVSFDSERLAVPAVYPDAAEIGGLWRPGGAESGCSSVGPLRGGYGDDVGVRSKAGPLAAWRRRLRRRRRDRDKEECDPDEARRQRGPAGGQALAGEVSTKAVGRQRRRPTFDAISGAAAGCLVSIFLHPVDTVKVLVQTELGAGRSSRNLLQVFRKLVTQGGGPKRLYYGLATNLASSIPISAIYTSSYEAAKHGLHRVLGHKDQERKSWVVHCLAGASASVATSFVYTPSECIKNRVQAGLYTNSWRALTQVITQEGPFTLYRAWPAVLLRNVPQSIVKFFAYEQLKAAVHQWRGRPATTAEMLAIGGLAGASGALFSTPFDVVKTRMQTQVGRAAQLSLGQTFKQVLLQEGAAGLYRGVLPRILIYLSQGAIFFTSYEVIQNLINLPHHQQQQQQQGLGGRATRKRKS
mmetsp:Transcript_4396/g.11233  ORF Transcript_4396/g.11233 Transcript_4396/m.11233 type:complete len:420 (-) Transcript_4396:50-1309(-)